MLALLGIVLMLTVVPVPVAQASPETLPAIALLKRVLLDHDLSRLNAGVSCMQP